MKVTWELRTGRESVRQKGELVGRVAKIDKTTTASGSRSAQASARSWPSGSTRGRAKSQERRRYQAIKADRLIAWQLNWRGENFYSGGEIWNPRTPDMHTEYMDNKKFLNYLKPRIGQGRKFWIVTERRPSNLASILPTDTAKKTIQTIELENSSNKFGLGSFTLDQAKPNASSPQRARPDRRVDTGGGL
jgi:hypothetical protein